MRANPYWLAPSTRIGFIRLPISARQCGGTSLSLWRESCYTVCAHRRVSSVARSLPGLSPRKPDDGNNNQRNDSGNSERYLQQWHGDGLLQHTVQPRSTTHRHSLSSEMIGNNKEQANTYRQHNNPRRFNFMSMRMTGKSEKKSGFRFRLTIFDRHDSTGSLLVSSLIKIACFDRSEIIIPVLIHT